MLGFGTVLCRVMRMASSQRVVVERLLVQNFISMPAPLFSREAAIRVGGLDEDLWYTADWDFWLKLAAVGQDDLMFRRPFLPSAFILTHRPYSAAPKPTIFAGNWRSFWKNTSRSMKPTHASKPAVTARREFFGEC